MRHATRRVGAALHLIGIVAPSGGFLPKPSTFGQNCAGAHLFVDQLQLGTWSPHPDLQNQFKLFIFDVSKACTRTFRVPVSALQARVPSFPLPPHTCALAKHFVYSNFPQKMRLK
jgi:hypothetical protein